MVFSSTTFLFFFLPAVLIVYFLPNLSRRFCEKHSSLVRRYKNIVLLLASLGFYAWGEPVFVFLMLGVILINWCAGLLMQKWEGTKGKKSALVVAVFVDVMLLFVFKYISFLSENLFLLTGNESVVVKIALPIGISFFTFQMMSYIFDVYYGHARAQKNLLDVALYIALFPQLIAGPIVRYQTIETEIYDRKESMTGFSDGMIRFVYGLGKKLLVANYMGLIADRIFAMDANRSVALAWLGAISYTLQIYYDFSGYSDMAIGLGQLFGFHFPTNFNYPYIAKSVTDFWRRWHITLSTWFRDYVYIPLGGNRVAKGKWVRNMLVVWLLTGIWHGANWTFVAWGLFYFVLLMLEKCTPIGRLSKVPVLNHVYTLGIVICAWVLFRADNLQSAVLYLGNMFGAGSDSFVDGVFWEYLKNSIFYLGTGIVFSMPVVPKLLGLLGERKQELFVTVTAVCIFILSLIVCVNSTYNPFIYFNF